MDDQVKISVIDKLLKDVRELEHFIGVAGKAVADLKLDDVYKLVPQTADKNLDQDGWKALATDKKEEAYRRLIRAHRELRSAAGLDGPTDPNHIMRADYATNRAILFWFVGGLMVIVGLLHEITDRWAQATNTDYAARIQGATVSSDLLAEAEKKLKNAKEAAHDARSKADEEKKHLSAEKKPMTSDKAKEEILRKLMEEAEKKDNEVLEGQAEYKKAEENAGKAAVEAVRALREMPTTVKSASVEGKNSAEERKGMATERTVLEMVVLLGALGGSLHFVGSFVGFVGNRSLKQCWLLYYLSLPLVGAALAPIVYMLLRVGILTPTGQANAGSAISNLNLIAIYGFAALTGMFAKVATEKLADVFDAIFQPKPDSEKAMKDKMGSEKAPGSTTSTS